MHHGSESTFGIAGSAAIHFAIVYRRLEGRNRHALYGDGIHMRLEDEAFGWILSIEFRDDIETLSAGWGGFDGSLTDSWNIVVTEKGLDESCYGALAGSSVIEGIHAIDTNQICQRRFNRLHFDSLFHIGTESRFIDVATAQDNDDVSISRKVQRMV